MKRLFLSFLVLFSFPAYSQFQVKQITNLDVDARNPKITKDFNVLHEGNLLFESHEGNAVNVKMLYYNPLTDSFYNLTSVTDNNFRNTNPAGYSGRIVFFETDMNGNKDIAFRMIYWDEMGETHFLTTSSEDEFNPATFVGLPFGATQDSIFLLYQSGISVYHASTADSSFSHLELFPGYIDNIYSKPTAGYVGWWYGSYPRPGFHVAALRTTIAGVEDLVYRYKTHSGVWEEEQIIIQNCQCMNPEFVIFNEARPVLTYEKIEEGRKKIFVMNDWEQQRISEVLVENVNGDVGDFDSDVLAIVTNNSETGQNTEIFAPHSYKLIRGDGSSFIRVNYEDLSIYPIDTLIQTKVINTRPTVGLLSYDSWDGAAFYTVWEDSTGDKIQLFGRVHYMYMGNVDDFNSQQKDFILYQNYPNPFNPNTVISYQLPVSGNVTLKVYDLLGREVAALVDEYKPAGRYEVEFNAVGTRSALSLPSGVYIYRLTAGNYSDQKKLILLK